MTFQLNVNLGFENGGVRYVYWIQDVAWVDTSTDTVYAFENNIWNFSSSSFCLSNSAVSGTGQVYPISGCEGYYAVGVDAAPALVYPGTFEMKLNTTVNGAGRPVVEFMYDTGGGFTTFDTVTFGFANSLDYSDGFVVDGAGYNPTGYLDYDAEFIMGGPGGGSSTTVVSSAVDLFLAYWNGHNYQSVTDAKNFGYDTAESVSSASSVGSYQAGTGQPFAEVTFGVESQNALWYSSELSTVEIEGPGSSDAIVDTGPTSTGYLAGYASLALWPTFVDFVVICAGFPQDLGSPALSAGSTTILETGTWATLTFGETGLPPGTLWATRVAGDTESAAGGPIVFYVPAASHAFEVTVGPTGYLPSPAAGTVTVADSGASVTFQWQRVALALSPSSHQVDLGQTATFGTNLANTTGDSFSWTGLPSGCSPLDLPNLSCRPSAVGLLQVSVTVSTQGGLTATAAIIAFTVFASPAQGPPVASPRASTDVGHPFVFTAPVSGGSGGGAYVWIYPAGLGCSSSDNASLACDPSVAMNYTLSYQWTDSDGVEAAGATSLLVRVYLDPSQATPSETTTSADLGQGVTFSAVTQGGSGGGAYSWTAPVDLGCSTSSGPSLSCHPTVAGTFNVSCRWTDSNGVSALGVARLTFVVYTDPTVSSIIPSSTSSVVGDEVTLTANVSSNGSGNLSYRWEGLPPGCGSVNTSSVTCVPSGTGNFLVSVLVVDSNGQSASSPTTSLSITARPPGSTSAETYLILGSGVAAFALGLIVLVVQRARRPR